MDCIPINEAWTNILLNYGSIVLFILLALGIVALPIPDETLMVLAGVLMSQGSLFILPTILAALAGSMCGISFSYLIGRTGGSYLVHKYGSWFGITDKRLEVAHDWFRHYGKWMLTIGYFIPCVRHFTGITAGTSGLEYPLFALFAYSGAIIWVSTFLSLGYFFGGFCFEFLEKIDTNTTLAIGAIALLIILYIVIAKKMNSKNQV